MEQQPKEATNGVGNGDERPISIQQETKETKETPPVQGSNKNQREKAIEIEKK